MSTCVAFLRAINLGPTRKLPMSTVTEALQGAGLRDLDTYLATGNVRLEAGGPVDRIRDEVAATLSAAAGFEVPVVLVTAEELRTVHAEVHALDDGAAGRALRRHVAFLPARPTAQARAELDAWSSGHAGEGAHVGVDHLHWWTDGSTADAVVFAPATLRRLGLQGATSRTVKVVDTLVARWC